MLLICYQYYYMCIASTVALHQLQESALQQVDRGPWTVGLLLAIVFVFVGRLWTWDLGPPASEVPKPTKDLLRTYWPEPTRPW